MTCKGLKVPAAAVTAVKVEAGAEAVMAEMVAVASAVAVAKAAAGVDKVHNSIRT